MPGKISEMLETHNGTVHFARAGYKIQLPYFQWLRLNWVPLAALVIYRAEDTVYVYECSQAACPAVAGTAGRPTI